MATQEIASWALGVMHGCLTVILGLGGALMTADCLSRERREGTLGLLFLTPLSAGDVALGKCASQLLRLGAIWLSMLPLLAVPVLLGGVTARNLFDALLAEASAALTGVAAGLLATAYCRRWGWAMFLAVGWLMVFYVSHIALSGLALFVNYVVIKSGSIDGYALLALPIMPLLVGIGLPLEGPSGAGIGSGEMIRMGRLMLGLMGGWSTLLFTTAFLLLYGALARRQEDGSSATTPATEATRIDNTSMTATSAALVSLALGRHRPALQPMGRNPFYWLETRAAFFRRGSWFLAFVVAGVSYLGYVGGRDAFWLVALAYSFPALIAIAAVFLAAASFRQEQEEGGWELLLCTPLTPFQLLSGRLAAVGRALLPGYIIAALLVGLAAESQNDRSEFLTYIAVTTFSGVAAMALALYTAIRRINPLVAFVFGLVGGFVLPYALSQVIWVFLQWFWGREILGYAPVIETSLGAGVFVLQLVMAAIGLKYSHRALRERDMNPWRWRWRRWGARAARTVPATQVMGG